MSNDYVPGRLLECGTGSAYVPGSVMDKSISQIKINIGCGPTGRIPGFIDLDNSPSILLDRMSFVKEWLYKLDWISREQYVADWRNVTWCDASKRLPFMDESVEKIYSSHFLEHVPQDKGRLVLEECWRCLKKDGVMRLVVPDLLWYAERYIMQTKEIINTPSGPEDRSAHDIFLQSIYGAYLRKRRFGAEHCYMYDYPTLFCLLKDIGFRSIQKREYQIGEDAELAACDSRPEESLHLEIRKD